MVLVQKWPFFELLFLGNIGQENVFYDILEQKILFQALKTRSLKSRKIDINIFPKGLTHDFGPKIVIFPSFFFLGNIAQENVFYDFLERKSAFLRYTIRVTHGFSPKIAIFLTFFLGQIGQENVFYDILERKKGLLGYRINNFK